MALQSTYKQFIAAPNPALLAESASLHYITTLTTYNGSAEIIKHLTAQSRGIKKKGESFIDAVEAPNALAVEVDTTLEFLTTGGAYLPGLDDNFLADRTVTFPVIHIVSFDANGKITQIRQNWDQGSLLKLIDVIGKTGRNWPIRDGKDQIKLIANSVKSTARPGATFAAPVAATAHPEETIRRSRENSTNVTRDPHASLALFAPRDQSISDSLPAVVAPRASAKPPPRDYHDLFVGNESDSSPATNKLANRVRSDSPSKLPGVIAPKGGAGKNFQPSRLFDNDENSPIRPSPARDHSTDHFYRPNPKKYQHFDFADGSDEPEVPKPTTSMDAPIKVKSKHGSNWNFDDFNTPGKHVPGKVQKTADVRHWGNENDEVLESPIRKPKIDKPRKDAETHFEFVDDGTPEGAKRMIGRPRGQGMDSGMGLYQNYLFDEDEETSQQKPESRPLNNVTNIKDRRKDFDPHFAITDDSPATKPSDSTSQKENTAPVASPSRAGTGKGPLSESSNTLSDRNDNPKGISIGGDGMGGKKGGGRAWGFGDDSDGEEAGGLNGKGGAFSKGVSGKKQGSSAQTGGGDFWNY